MHCPGRTGTAGLGCAVQDLESRRKGGPRKAKIAARLRRESTTSLAWIAPRLPMAPPAIWPVCLILKTIKAPALKISCSDPALILRERSSSWKFKRLQRRRGQTEARISIVKNVFLNGRLRSKGFTHRALTVTWTVLVHNLWVLARMQVRAKATPTQAQAA